MSNRSESDTQPGGDAATSIQGTGRLDRGAAIVERWGLVLASVSLLMLTVLMIAETALRYALGMPIGWSYNFIQDYLLPAMFFASLAMTYRSDSHVSVDALYNRLDTRTQVWLTRIGRLLILAFSLLAIWAGIISTHGAWQANDIPPPGGSQLSIPTWTWHILAPLGFSLLAIRLVVDLIINRPTSAPHWTEETL